MKKTILGMSVIVTIMLFGACTDNEEKMDNDKNIGFDIEKHEVTKEDVEDSSMGGSVIVENETEEDDFTEEKALSAVQALWSQAKKYAGKDYFAFKKLFVDTSDEDLQKLYEADFHQSEYDKTNYVVIGFDYPYAYIQIEDYIVAGTHPNTHMRSFPNIMVIVYKNNEWKLVYNEEVIQGNKKVINNQELYHAGFVDAKLSGRNSVMFGSSYMYLDSSAVFKGFLETRVLFAWQQEDGSVCIGVFIANGTNENIAYKSADITLTDQTYGEILNVSGNVNWIIRANTSAVQYIVIDAVDIKTGTQQWTSISGRIEVHY